MASVTIYTGKFCPYCTAAKRLLGEKGVAYDEIDVTFNRSKRAHMRELTGRTSVPQIFVGDHHVGGCDDLYALDEAGKLDPLLAG